MKLLFSAGSPFVRKVRITAALCGLDARIEAVPVDAWASPGLLVDANPLSRVPCLITDDGMPLFDSPVICEYLDSLEGGLPLFPPGAARWRALKLQAVGDGILDAAVGRRGEQAKPEEAARTAWMERQKAAVGRALTLLEREPPHRALDIGSIAVACALGYLDFRFGTEPWRDGHPKLAAWYAEFAKNKALADTAPKE